MVIPASTKKVSIKGMLSIPEPGKSPEYIGTIDLKIDKPAISAAAGMRLAPKHRSHPNPFAWGYNQKINIK